MRLQKYINEEYYTRFRGFNGKSFEIFKNPSAKELKSISRNEVGNKYDLRFIADNTTKDTYMWLWDAINHDNMIKKHLSKEFKGKKYEDPSLFLGTSDDKGNVTGNDTLEWFMHNELDLEYIDGITSINWNWAKPFQIMKYLKKLNIIK